MCYAMAAGLNKIPNLLDVVLRDDFLKNTNSIAVLLKQAEQTIIIKYFVYLIVFRPFDHQLFRTAMEEM